MILALVRSMVVHVLACIFFVMISEGNTYMPFEASFKVPSDIEARLN